jgi:hypothetical protein
MVKSSMYMGLCNLLEYSALVQGIMTYIIGRYPPTPHGEGSVGGWIYPHPVRVFTKPVDILGRYGDGYLDILVGERQ